MSKPLIFLLELIALVIIIGAAVADPFNIVWFVIGIGLAIVAAVAFRKRAQK